MHSPRITVITVTKNDLVRLKRTAKSILSQDSADFEWLVVDAFSEDGTSDYLRDYPTPGNFIFVRQQSSGIYSAMNLGVQHSNGEYLWFLNAGDLFTGTNSISSAIREINSNSSDLHASSVINFTPSGFVLGVTAPRVSSNGEFVANHQGILVSKKLFIKLGGFRIDLELASDGFFLDSAARASSVNLINSAFVGFELGGTSSRYFRKLVKEIATYRIPLSWLEFTILSIKNYFRNLLLVIDRKWARNPLNFIFRVRENSQIGKSYLNQLEKFHFIQHDVSQPRLLKCCQNNQP
jgi:glycosyltransferase involved in cell wall biosynthesis